MRHSAFRGSLLARLLVFVAVVCGLSAAAPSAAVLPAAAKPARGAELAVRILKPLSVRSGATARVTYLRMQRYIPQRHQRFANRLLAGIVPSQRWGIPAAAAPRGYRTYFKGGWLGAFILANQAARLERGKVKLGLAVFTDGNPSSGYGLETIRGTTARLLSR